MAAATSAAASDPALAPIAPARAGSRAPRPSPPSTLSTLLTGCDLVPVGDGSFRAVPRKPTNRVSVREAARLANCSLTTIYRLFHAGFITGERQSPRKIVIEPASLQAHLEALRDPGFWTPERRARYWTVL